MSLTPAAFIDPEMYWENDDNPRLRVCRFMISPFFVFLHISFRLQVLPLFSTGRKEKFVSNEIEFYVTTMLQLSE